MPTQVQRRPRSLRHREEQGGGEKDRCEAQVMAERHGNGRAERRYSLSHVGRDEVQHRDPEGRNQGWLRFHRRGKEMRIEGVADKCVSSIVSVTPTVTCQAATITCHCGSFTITRVQPCGAASPLDCTSIRNEAVQDCVLNGQPTDDCQAASCTDACTGQPCGGGCPSPRADCGGFCVDTSTDRQNCGSCGHLCLPNEVCSGGNCACQSPNALYGCATACFCADLQTNPNDCGSCGHVCTSGVC